VALATLSTCRLGARSPLLRGERLGVCGGGGGCPFTRSELLLRTRCRGGKLAAPQFLFGVARKLRLRVALRELRGGLSRRLRLSRAHRLVGMRQQQAFGSRRCEDQMEHQPVAESGLVSGLVLVYLKLQWGRDLLVAERPQQLPS
jgi:hypothetical protein